MKHPHPLISMLLLALLPHHPNCCRRFLWFFWQQMQESIYDHLDLQKKIDSNKADHIPFKKLPSGSDADQGA